MQNEGSFKYHDSWVLIRGHEDTGKILINAPAIDFLSVIPSDHRRVGIPRRYACHEPTGRPAFLCKTAHKMNGSRMTLLRNHARCVV